MMLTKGPHYTALVSQLTREHNLYPSLQPQALHSTPPETYKPGSPRAAPEVKLHVSSSSGGNTQTYSVHCRQRNQEQRAFFPWQDHLLSLDQCFLQRESKKKNLGKVEDIHGNNAQIKNVEETENH